MNIRCGMLATALGAAALAISAAPAVASASAQGASVQYSDLDLSSEAGRAELAKRFDQAARALCDAGDGKLRGRARYCYENTSKSLKMRVAAILADHEAKGG
jgi:UrcA family protein